MNSRLETTLKVIERIKKETDNDEVRIDVDFGCTNPAQMAAVVYDRLQSLTEALEMSRARGEDCLPGFDELQDEVDRLMGESPWTLHPDEGLVRKGQENSDLSIS